MEENKGLLYRCVDVIVELTSKHYMCDSDEAREELEIFYPNEEMIEDFILLDGPSAHNPHCIKNQPQYEQTMEDIVHCTKCLKEYVLVNAKKLRTLRLKQLQTKLNPCKCCLSEPVLKVKTSQIQPKGFSEYFVVECSNGTCKEWVHFGCYGNPEILVEKWNRLNSVSRVVP